MCPPMRAHWRHLANTIVFVLPSAHLSSQLKRQINQFSCFCTDHGRKSLYLTMGTPFPKNCHYPWGISTPYNTIPWARFCTGDCRVSLYFTMGCPFPLKIATSHGGCGPPSNTWFLGPNRVLNLNGILIGSAILQGSLVWQTDRQTEKASDKPCYSVGNNRTHLHTQYCDAA